MIKAFIFDFDGLILDTEVACYETWQDIYKECNANLPFEEWSKCIGSSEEAFDPLDYLASRTVTSFSRDSVQAIHQQRYRNLTRQLNLMPGVLDFIEFAKANHLALAVASSSKREWVISHLEDLGILAQFDSIMTGDDVSKVKPDPELFEITRKRLALAPFESVVFEDSPNGITAAINAECFTVAVPNALTRELNLSHAHKAIESLAQVTPDEIIQFFDHQKETK